MKMKFLFGFASIVSVLNCIGYNETWGKYTSERFSEVGCGYIKDKIGNELTLSDGKTSLKESFENAYLLVNIGIGAAKTKVYELNEIKEKVKLDNISRKLGWMMFAAAYNAKEKYDKAKKEQKDNTNDTAISYNECLSSVGGCDDKELAHDANIYLNTHGLLGYINSIVKSDMDLCEDDLTVWGKSKSESQFEIIDGANDRCGELQTAMEQYRKMFGVLDEENEEDEKIVKAFKEKLVKAYVDAINAEGFKIDFGTLDASQKDSLYICYLNDYSVELEKYLKDENELDDDKMNSFDKQGEEVEFNEFDKIICEINTLKKKKETLERELKEKDSEIEQLKGYLDLKGNEKGGAVCLQKKHDDEIMLFKEFKALVGELLAKAENSIKVNNSNALKEATENLIKQEHIAKTETFISKFKKFELGDDWKHPNFYLDFDKNEKKCCLLNSDGPEDAISGFYSAINLFSSFFCERQDEKGNGGVKNIIRTFENKQTASFDSTKATNSVKNLVGYLEKLSALVSVKIDELKKKVTSEENSVYDKIDEEQLSENGLENQSFSKVIDEKYEENEKLEEQLEWEKLKQEKKLKEKFEKLIKQGMTDPIYGILEKVFDPYKDFAKEVDFFNNILRIAEGCIDAIYNAVCFSGFDYETIFKKYVESVFVDWENLLKTKSVELTFGVLNEIFSKEKIEKHIKNSLDKMKKEIADEINDLNSKLVKKRTEVNQVAKEVKEKSNNITNEILDKIEKIFKKKTKELKKRQKELDEQLRLVKEAQKAIFIQKFGEKIKKGIGVSIFTNISKLIDENYEYLWEDNRFYNECLNVAYQCVNTLNDDTLCEVVYRDYETLFAKYVDDVFADIKKSFANEDAKLTIDILNRKIAEKNFEKYLQNALRGAAVLKQEQKDALVEAFREGMKKLRGTDGSNAKEVNDQNAD